MVIRNSQFTNQNSPIAKPSAGLSVPGRTRRSNIIAWVTAIALTIVAAFLDLLLHDISISLVIVLAIALLVGTIWRERAWRWGIVTGLSVPVPHLIRDTLIRHDPLAPSLALVASFIPSFVGAYMGAFLNKMVSALFGREDA
jgi:hypothetical protein